MRTVIFDSETDGLNPKLVHCIVCKDVKTNEFFYFRQEECYNEFKEFAKEIKYYICHNIIGFDRPRVLNGILDLNVPLSACWDTLVLSRLLDTNRHFKEIAWYKANTQTGFVPSAIKSRPHSLEAWGIRTGLGKPDHSDWDTYSEAMLKRCAYDVEINHRAWKKLLKEMDGFSPECIRLEHQVSDEIFQMRENGFYLDVAKARKLQNTCKAICSELEEQMRKDFPAQKKFVRKFTPRWSKEKVFKTKENIPPQINATDLKTLKRYIDREDLVCEYKGIGISQLDEAFLQEGMSFDLYEMEEFNLQSVPQVKEKLDNAGWKPVNFNKPTPKMQEEGIKQGSPKISDEENLATLPSDAPQSIKNIGRYLTIANRVSMVNQWWAALEEDGRVHGFINAQGAITGRMTHASPNMANIPAVVHDENDNVLKGEEGNFGYDSRACWTVPDLIRYCIVGADAAGLELRMFAHYLNDKEYIDVVLNGDIHTYNQEAFGAPTRNHAKTLIYAMLYGAGDAKIGSVIGGSAKDGADIKNAFRTALPAYARLVDRIETDAVDKGYVYGLDGRKIWIRSKHKALNSLLQGGGAIVMKKALCLCNDEIRRRKLDAKDVNNIHDEFQKEVLRDHAEETGQIMVQSMIDTGVHFNLNCPMDGEYKIGDAWSDTH